MPFVDTTEGEPERIEGDRGDRGANTLLLAEVRKLESKRPMNWMNSLLVLAGTIGLFIGLGGVAWDWKFTLLLIPILLFHEAGHFLAMRLFDYRNVQMFFVPLLGAAVAGRHYNVPGWKRVVTSLMGPVPGILAGTALGVVAMVQGQTDSLLMEAATLTVVLNGFNLLPALPLDGGWVLHGLLFSRHTFLDLLSRLFAIGAMFFLAFAGGAKFLMYVGIAMLVGLPASYHLARITDRLRARGLPSGGDEGHAPAEAVETISAELDKAYPKGLDVRAKAKLALQVFENVNSRPPGWLATLTLGAVYLGSIGVSVVAALVFTLAQNADLNRLLDDAMLGPQTVVSSSDIEAHPPGPDPAGGAWDQVLVVNAASSEEASDLLESGKADAREIVRFGSTLLLRLAGDPDEQDQLFDRYESLSDDVFLARDDEGFGLQIFAIAGTGEDADRIARAFRSYSKIPVELRPVPPWAGDRPITPDERVARATVESVTSNDWMENVEIADDWYERLNAAQRRGRDELVAEIEGELAEQNRVARDAYLGGLADKGADEIDSVVLEAYLAALKVAEAKLEAGEDDDELPEFFDVGPAAPTAEDWLPPLAGRLGCYPPGEPEPAARSVSVGYADANGLTLNLNATMKSLPAAPIVVVRWLEAEGCSDIKYRLSKGWL